MVVINMVSLAWLGLDNLASKRRYTADACLNATKYKTTLEEPTPIIDTKKDTDNNKDHNIGISLPKYL